jgi:hypothetical protein
MALVAFFVLLSILSPATASSQSVVRRTAIKVNSNARLNAQSGASAKALSTKARAWKRVAKWQALREQLQSQHKLRRISEAGRNEALWYAVQEVDSKSHEKYKCQLQDGVAFVGYSMLHMPIIRDRRTNIQSARECALMCAADPLRPKSDEEQQQQKHRQQQQKHEQCKSFSYNWTRHECSFFGVSPEESPDTWIKDDCCTAGPPCNLQGMHVQMIQQTYEAELAQLSNHVVGNSMADAEKLADSDAKKKLSSPVRVVTSNSSVASAVAPSTVALQDASSSGKETMTMRLLTGYQRYQHVAITSMGLFVPLLAMFLIRRCMERYFFQGSPSLKLDRQLQNDNLVFAERNRQ